MIDMTELRKRKATRAPVVTVAIVLASLITGGHWLAQPNNMSARVVLR